MTRGIEPHHKCYQGVSITEVIKVHTKLKFCVTVSKDDDAVWPKKCSPKDFWGHRPHINFGGFFFYISTIGKVLINICGRAA